VDDEDDESDDVSVRLEATSPAMLKKKKKKYVNEDGEEWRNCRQQKKGIIALSMHIIKKADNSMLIYFS